MVNGSLTSLGDFGYARLVRRLISCQSSAMDSEAFWQRTQAAPSITQSSVVVQTSLPEQ